MNEPILFEIRCPFERLSKSDGQLYICNALCGRLTAGSSGELRCRKCRFNFWAEVDGRARRTTGVRLKKVQEENESK